MEDSKTTRKAAVNEAMDSVLDQVKSCSDAIKDLKQDRKDQLKVLEKNHKEAIKLINENHKESLKTIDVAQNRLNNTLKKLKKFKKNPNVELDDVVLLQKKKNTSALKKFDKIEKNERKEAEKTAKLERKNSAKDLKEAEKTAKLERKNSAKDLKEAENTAKLERKNSAKDLKEAENTAKLERKNSAKKMKDLEKTAKIERKNSEKEIKQLYNLERKNSMKEIKETTKREQLEAKQAAVALKKNKSSIEFTPSKRAALLISTNDTKKSSGNATMKNFLINKLGFEESSIMTLSNMTKDANKMKILERLDELIETANEQGCDEIWFYYSGDSTIITNTKTEEYEDGIIPSDYKEKGVINSMTFNGRLENIVEGIKVYVLLDCCHNENFLETSYEYCGGNDNVEVFNESRNYNADITVFTLRSIELEFKNKGIITNANAHILARMFIEHYNECVEDECSNVTIFSMLNDMRDYLVFNEIELLAVLNSPVEVKNNTSLLSIN
jgi:hypothetical protein